MTRKQKRAWKKNASNLKASVAIFKAIIKEQLYGIHHEAALELRKYVNSF